MNDPIFTRVFEASSTQAGDIHLRIGTAEGLAADFLTSIDGANAIAAALSLQRGRLLADRPDLAPDEKTTFIAESIRPEVADDGTPVISITLSNGAELALEFEREQLREALTYMLALTADTDRAAN